MKNTFTVDYTKKELDIVWKGEKFNFDLNEGDVGDFWNSFKLSDGTQMDISFYQSEADQEPSVMIYGVKMVDGKLLIDTDDNYDIDDYKTIGDASTYIITEELEEPSQYDWIHHLIPIIDDYKDGDTTKLSADDVDSLMRTLKAKVNLREGNITREEYEIILG